MNDRDITIQEIYARRRERKRKRRIRNTCLLLVLALALCGGLYWYFQKGSDPKDSTIQNPPTDPTTTVEPTQNTEDPTQSTEEPTDPTEEPTEPTASTALYSEASLNRAQEILDGMTDDEKIYQMFIITPEQLTGVKTATRSGEMTKTAIGEYPVGGLVYFAQNIEDSEQITEMISGVQGYSKLGLFIAVDEEGGSVSRLGANEEVDMRQLDPMGTITTEEDAKAAGKALGTGIAKYGFNLDFAPVADVNADPDNDVIGDRAFSSDYATAARLVAACTEGFKESGTLCTLKHFPGHGTTDGDSHEGTAVSERTLDEMLAEEVTPFAAGINAGADLVMVGHITCKSITGNSMPASLSKTIVTDLLRNTLGFHGLIITDALNMPAITGIYNSDKAAVKAVQAGCDLLLMPEDLDDAVDGIRSALESGTITAEQIDQSVLRILAAKVEAGIIK